MNPNKTLENYDILSGQECPVCRGHVGVNKDLEVRCFDCMIDLETMPDGVLKRKVRWSYMSPNEATKRIRKALRAASGKAWSCTHGRGTGYGWIRIESPPARRVDENGRPLNKDSNRHGFMPLADQLELAELLGLVPSTQRYDRDLGLVNRPTVHYQGHQIDPDSREYWVWRIEAMAYGIKCHGCGMGVTPSPSDWNNDGWQCICGDGAGRISDGPFFEDGVALQIMEA